MNYNQRVKKRAVFPEKIDMEIRKQLMFAKEQNAEIVKKVKFEKKLKKSEQYLASMIQFVNIVDNKGMSSLHYAIKSLNLPLIKSLIETCEANLYIRDYKFRAPVDMLQIHNHPGTKLHRRTYLR